MRLNRYFSVCGVSSRRHSEHIIREGHVAVNGQIVTDPAWDVNPLSDRVTVDGVLLTMSSTKRYFVMRKPTGIIVSRGDTHGRATVFDLLGAEAMGIFPVGRLDADTSGVLLLTDDGDLSYRLTHPSFGIEKIYRSEVIGKMTESDVKTLERGVQLEGGTTAPARVRILTSGEESSLVEIILHEGKKRQVRRMLSSIGHPVRMLERVSFGGITADGIPYGGYRPLDPKEIDQLKEKVSLHTHRECL